VALYVCKWCCCYRGVGVVQRWRHLPVWLYTAWVQVFNVPASLHRAQKQCHR